EPTRIARRMPERQVPAPPSRRPASPCPVSACAIVCPRSLSVTAASSGPEGVGTPARATAIDRPVHPDREIRPWPAVRRGLVVGHHPVHGAARTRQELTVRRTPPPPASPFLSRRQAIVPTTREKPHLWATRSGGRRGLPVGKHTRGPGAAIWSVRPGKGGRVSFRCRSRNRAQGKGLHGPGGRRRCGRRPWWGPHRVETPYPDTRAQGDPRAVLCRTGIALVGPCFPVRKPWFSIDEDSQRRSTGNDRTGLCPGRRVRVPACPASSQAPGPVVGAGGQEWLAWGPVGWSCRRRRKRGWGAAAAWR